MKINFIFLLTFLTFGCVNAQNFVMMKPIIDSSNIRQDLYMCGVIRNISINCMENNEDAVIINGIWRKRIHIQSTEAKEIKIIFSKFELSTNAVVSLYSDKKILACQYKGNLFIERLDRTIFTSGVIHGDMCAIVIEVPIEEIQSNDIVISKIKHYSEPLSSILKNANNDFSCMIDVNSAEGNNWCNQKRSVAMYIFNDDGEMYVCTGALVNNYQNDFKQYFLTARHCTNGYIYWEDTEFHFNFQKPSHNEQTTNNNNVVYGAQLLDYCATSWSDNALLQITESIPIQYNVFYAGIDVSNRNMGDDVTCIHHSKGLSKKITTGDIEFYAGPTWDIYWDNGVIAGGGSGSPVFLNSNKNIIGTISHGLNYDCNSNMKHDWIGKLKSCSDIKNTLFGNSNLNSISGIDPIRNCKASINLSGSFFPTQDYDATLNGLTIQASQTISVSNATFKTSSNYTLTAGEKIILLPGFKVELGASFTSNISPCLDNLQLCGEH